MLHALKIRIEHEPIRTSLGVALLGASIAWIQHGVTLLIGIVIGGQGPLGRVVASLLAFAWNHTYTVLPLTGSLGAMMGFFLLPERFRRQCGPVLGYVLFVSAVALVVIPQYWLFVTCTSGPADGCVF